MSQRLRRLNALSVGSLGAIVLGLAAGAIGMPRLNAATPVGAAAVLTVNPQMGNDATAGAGRGSFRTIARALETAEAIGGGVTIQLAPGTYSAASGERFPLRLGDGITLVGDLGGRGQNVLIQGAGGFSSRTFSQQAVALVITGSSTVTGVTVSNPVQRGTGIWVEGNGATPTISNSRLMGNHRDGIFVSGSTRPNILSNLFQNNGGNGLSIAREASGVVRSNQFQATGFGITIGGTASPSIDNNTITQNRDGVVISNSAQPTLRRNQIQGNLNDGLVIIDRAQPDLGTLTSPGGNRILNNGRYAIFNANRGATIPAVGNDVDAARVIGPVLLSRLGADRPTIARWMPRP